MLLLSKAEQEILKLVIVETAVYVMQSAPSVREGERPRTFAAAHANQLIGLGAVPFNLCSQCEVLEELSCLLPCQSPLLLGVVSSNIVSDG